MPLVRDIVVTKLPKCDFYFAKAEYDAKTRDCDWAYICEYHFRLHGIVLGVSNFLPLSLPRQCTGNLSELSTRFRVERIAYPQPAMLSPKRASNTRNAAKAIALPKIEASPIIWRTMSQKPHLGRTLARTTATLKTRYPETRAKKPIRNITMKPLFVDRASYSKGELAAM